MKCYQLFCFMLVGIYQPIIIYSQDTNKTESVDALKYSLILDVDVTKGQFNGVVFIDFLAPTGSGEVTFDCGNLQIEEVSGINVLRFVQKNRKIKILLKDKDFRKNTVKITYAGSPSHGIIFDFEKQEVYTVFSTSQWMVCNEDPNDRATFKIAISVPENKKCVASGVLTNTSNEGDKIRYSWVQGHETPSYTYGFAIGSFNSVQEIHNKVELNYHATSYTSAELRTIFERTGEIIDFFETKAGIPFIQSSYSQILIGNHYQEMSGFAILKKSYGKLVLKDSTETNLISHELAHQWWGNMVTCRNWNHFWLNEGIATFMSAAFNEYKFGRAKYESDIASYREVYQSVKTKGKDKALVFDNWLHLTKEDRNLVYFKGAYVIHLLRAELGEKDFWYGLKSYTQQYFGKSVDTVDFQKAMEKSTGQDLSSFFMKWVY